MSGTTFIQVQGRMPIVNSIYAKLTQASLVGSSYREGGLSHHILNQAEIFKGTIVHECRTVNDMDKDGTASPDFRAEP